MTSYNTDGKSGPWAKEKWAVLERYLFEYCKVLKNQHFKTYYVDAFAGTGRAQMRQKPEEDDGIQLAIWDYQSDPEYEEYVDGSALKALATKYPFDGYLFLEPNKKRANKLEKAINGHPRQKLVRVRREPAEVVLRNRIVQNQQIDWKSTHAVCFLDPFAMQVEWDLLELIASTSAIEVVVNFPLGTAIQRQPHRDGQISEQTKEMLNRYFGIDEWFEVIYETRDTLFGSETLKADNAAQRIVDWYVDRLRGLFGYAASPRLIKNTRGTHLYYLLWAGPHLKGMEIANCILLMDDVTEVGGDGYPTIIPPPS